MTDRAAGDPWAADGDVLDAIALAAAFAVNTIPAATLHGLADPSELGAALNAAL
jgi:hypothetical protein